MANIIVCGGRDFTDAVAFNQGMEKFLEYWGRGDATAQIDILIQGGARGVDYLAAGWAWRKKIPYLTVPADWEKYGKRAGYIRNSQMVTYFPVDIVVAFPGGKGTQMMKNIAIDEGIPIYEVQSN